MFRLRYIYDFADVFLLTEEHLRENFILQGRRYGWPEWVRGAVRGLLEHELYLAIVPDPKIPHVKGDPFGLLQAHPSLLHRLHYQIQRPSHLTHEWVRVSTTPEYDLFIEYDFRPRDWSPYCGPLEDLLPYAEDLPTARSG